jgi:hypothetical protein
MSKRTGIFGLCLAACFALPAIPSVAQVKLEELQGLKSKSTEAIIPLPSGGALQGKGLDAWMNGLGPGGQAGIVRGFSGGAKTQEQKFFALGGLYTALLVQARSVSTLEAADAINNFRQALSQLQAPAGFFSYLSELELMTKSHEAGPEVAGRIVGAIQGFLSEFVRSRGDAAYLNYQAGRWCTTLALAARARDAAGLQLGAASYFHERFAAQHAGETALAALKGLEDLARREKLSDADFAQIEKLAEQLRDQLG